MKAAITTEDYKVGKVKRRNDETYEPDPAVKIIKEISSTNSSQSDTYGFGKWPLLGSSQSQSHSRSSDALSFPSSSSCISNSQVTNSTASVGSTNLLYSSGRVGQKAALDSLKVVRVRGLGGLGVRG